jgi:hypothetical protein
MFSLLDLLVQLLLLRLDIEEVGIIFGLSVIPSLVTLAFKYQLAISWMLRNRWNNCLFLVINMYFVGSHIYREENHVANKLANLDLDINDSLWFDSFPIVFRSDLVRNRVGLNFGEIWFISPSYASLSLFILSF